MSKAKLNQIIAVTQGMKTRAQKRITEAHHGWNPDAISGIAKTYSPKDEDGDKLPPESKRIHVDVSAKVRETMEQVVSFIDAVMTQDEGNTKARSDIAVNGAPLLADVPVTSLLFIEKQLVDLRTFVDKLPTLPLDREWAWNENRNCWATSPIDTVRTQKRPKVIVKYEATKEHPAQTEMIGEDVVAGTWTTQHMSSAIPAQKKAEMMTRVEALQDAVKRAREHANSIDVEQLKRGQTIVDYVFGDMTRAQSKP